MAASKTAHEGLRIMADLRAREYSLTYGPLENGLLIVVISASDSQRFLRAAALSINWFEGRAGLANLFALSTATTGSREVSKSPI